MSADARHPVNVTRLAVLVTALVLGGAAPALAQSAASDDPYDPGEGPSEPAAISVLKTAEPASVPEPGGEVSFSVVVTHDEPGATAVDITSLIDDVHGDLDGRGSCVLPQTIEPGGAYACSFSAMVAGAPGYVEIDTVTAAGIDRTGAALTASDGASVTITDVPALLTVEKQATPGRVPEAGGDVTFSVSVGNASSVDTISVESVIDDVFGDIADACDVALPHELAPGEGFECTFEASLGGEEGTPHHNTVTVTGVDDDGNAVVASDDATVDFEAAEPVIDLELSQQFQPASVPTGSPTDLTVTITNQGPDPATGVVVTEVLPPGVTYVADDSGGAYDAGSGTWIVGDLAVHESAALTITTTVDEAGEFVAVAEVTAADQPDIDSSPADGMGDDWDDASVAAYTVLATSSIGDFVWVDANTNGVVDAGEDGFPGVRIRLTLPDGTSRWTTANADGRYQFVGLAAGEYRVRVIVPEGWAPTTARSLLVTLAEGEAYMDADFGLAQGLPVTGAPLESFVFAGLVLLAVGASLIAIDRRRKGPEIPAP